MFRLSTVLRSAISCRPARTTWSRALAKVSESSCVLCQYVQPDQPKNPAAATSRPRLAVLFRSVISLPLSTCASNHPYSPSNWLILAGPAAGSAGRASAPGSDAAETSEPGCAGSGTPPPEGALAEPRTSIPLEAGLAQRAAVFSPGPGEVSSPLR